MEFIIGLVLGIAVTMLGFLRLQSGTLKVYIPGNGEPPYPYLDLDRSLDFIYSKKYVIFKVDPSGNSQE